jgi:hypothetical protein
MRYAVAPAEGSQMQSGWLEGRNLHTEYRWSFDDDGLRNHANG